MVVIRSLLYNTMFVTADFLSKVLELWLAQCSKTSPSFLSRMPSGTTRMSRALFSSHARVLSSTSIRPLILRREVNGRCDLPFVWHHSHNCRSWTVPSAACLHQIYQPQFVACLVGSRPVGIDPLPVCLLLLFDGHEFVKSLALYYTKSL